MSIASELNRLLQAKSDLATSIANKGVTVPAATTIDGYAALVDQIQTGGGSHPLPQGAVQISYIQGDGNAFIDTGIKGSSSISFKLSLYFTSSFPEVLICVLGSRVANNNAAFALQYYRNTNKFWRWAFGNSTNTVNHGGTTGNYTVSNLDRSRVLITTGAKELTVEDTDSTFSNNFNIYLLAMNDGGNLTGIGGNAYTRIKSCKIFDSGELVRDYIPIRIGQVGYLFDKVSGQSFGNANSTGAFVLGADVT